MPHIFYTTGVSLSPNSIQRQNKAIERKQRRYLGLRSITLELQELMILGFVSA